MEIRDKMAEEQKLSPLTLCIKFCITKKILHTEDQKRGRPLRTTKEGQDS
jgi:hypothetical protein